MYLKIDNEPLLAEQELVALIFEIKRKHPNYGYRRVVLQIKKKDVQVNYKNILRILRENNLLCPKRKPRAAFLPFLNYVKIQL